MAMSGIFVVAFIIVPSVAFAFAEPEWNFIDAVYFVFISLTTIGLGDYIPGRFQSATDRDFFYFGRYR